MNNQNAARGRGNPRGGGNQFGRGRGQTAVPAQVWRTARADPKPKLKATDHNLLQYVTDSRFPKKEAFSIAVVDANRTHTVTYHRPIGITDLGDNEWVATPSDQIHYLFDRAKRPDEQAVLERRRIGALEILVERQLLQGEAPDYTYVDLGDLGPRRTLIATARRAAEEEAKAQGTKALADAYLAKLPPEVTTSEMRIRTTLGSEEFSDTVAERFPFRPYVTRSGQLADQDQWAIEFLTGKSMGEAKDTLLRMLYGLPPYSGPPSEVDETAEGVETEPLDDEDPGPTN